MPVYGENGEAKLSNFISEVNQAIKKKYGTDFEMMPSYGVTRTVIGACYAMIHRRVLDDPNQNIDQFVDEFIQSKEPIPAFGVRGIGSDLDFTVRSRSGVAIDSVTLKRIVSDVVAMLTDPSILKGGLSKDLDRSFYAIPDVKNYSEQTSWTRKQGGSEVDMIVYSLDDGKMIEPTEQTTVFSDIQHGIYRYIKGEPMDAESRQKQTIRGLRALVELPWMKLDPTSESLLIAELQQMRSDVEKNRKIGASAISQCEKLVRNSWFSAANSRLWGSEAVARELESLNRLYYSITKKMLVPRFLPYRTRPAARIDTFPQHLLTDRKTFVQNYTDNGRIYHATSRAGLAIIREGLILSNGEQGRATFGPGSYAAKSRKIALGAGSDSEFVFELRLREKHDVKIFEFQKNQNDPWVAAKIAELGGRDAFFDYLRETIGIDIIVNTYVLVQNSYCLVYPKTLRDLFDAAMAGDILNPKKLIDAYEVLEYAVKLFQYMKLSGEDISSTQDPGVLKDQTYFRIVESVRALDTSDIKGKDFREFWTILNSSIELPPELIKEKIFAVKNPNEKIPYYESLIISAVDRNQPEVFDAVLNHPEFAITDVDKAKLIKAYIRDVGIFNALWGHPDLIRAIIESAQSADVLNFVYRSIEANAVMDQSLLAEILEKIEDPNVKMGFPKYLFAWLVYKGNEQAVKAMLKNPRLDPNNTYLLGSPLQFAIRVKNIALIKILLNDQRVDLKTVKLNSFTPPEIVALVNDAMTRRQNPCVQIKEKTMGL